MQKLALLDDFWKKFGSKFRMFDVQVTAQRIGDPAQGQLSGCSCGGLKAEV